MKAHFSKMARYNAWANARIYAAARDLPDESYRRDVGAFFGSLRGTLNHILVADKIWMRRFTGTGDQPTKLNAILFDDLRSLELARKEEDARIIRYIEDLREDDVGKMLNYTTTSGVDCTNRLGDLLSHMFNHQTHHRGQAHAIFSILGVPEPPSLDLMLMFRENA
jgi:uncharacterized damage-inducible protein DinB